MVRVFDHKSSLAISSGFEPTDVYVCSLSGEAPGEHVMQITHTILFGPVAYTITSHDSFKIKCTRLRGIKQSIEQNWLYYRCIKSFLIPPKHIICPFASLLSSVYFLSGHVTRSFQ